MSLSVLQFNAKVVNELRARDRMGNARRFESGILLRKHGGGTCVGEPGMDAIVDREDGDLAFLAADGNAGPPAEGVGA